MGEKLGASRPAEVGFEDNFGYYHLDEPFEREFMGWICKASRVRRCARCGEDVRLLLGREVCSVCAISRELGGGS